MLAEYIDSIIMFLAGAYFTAVAFGRLPPPSKDPVAGQQWLARFGKMLKVIGPLLVVISIALAGATFFGVGG